MSRQHEKREVTSNYDIVLVMLVVLLSVFGLVMIYSTSYYNAAYYYSDEKLYFNAQGKYLMIGFAVMMVVSLVDYRIYVRQLKKFFNIRLIWLLYILCLGLQVYVLIGGHEAGGSARWIKVPIIGQFQPSELSKICVIMLTAFLVSKLANAMNHIRGFIAVSVYIVPLIALVAIENLSTAIIMAGIFVVICFVVTKRKWYYAVVGAIGALAVAGFVYFSSYRGDRIEQWLHPETQDPSSQTIQSLYAIASGGLWGKGLGESSQKLGYIREVHTDMIFSVICEELGMFGAIMVIAVFLMLLWRLLLIATNASDMYGGLIATGVMVHIALQVLLHIAVVTNSIPATGITFPFISYGGSSLMVLMTEMGLALSVSKYTRKRDEDDE